MKLPSDQPIQIGVTREYLERVERLLTALVKNAAHCFGVDFYDLNEALIETNKKLDYLHTNSTLK